MGNTTVSGTVQVRLTGQSFKNVEVFINGNLLSRATISADETTATAAIDTLLLPNGSVALTAHAWNSSAGTPFTSEADAGVLVLNVNNAVTPPPPAPTPVPGAWGSDLLGVYVGNNPADVARFDTWLGRPADAVLGYTGNASWADYDGSVGWAIGNWQPLNRVIFWSVPLIPNGADLAAAARGEYDEAHYKPAARKLVKFRPNDEHIHIRTGWEFNGGWFPWTAHGGKEANFAGAFRKFVDAFRAVARENGTPDRFIFEWNVNIGDQGVNPELAYPGDAWVDIIGMDFYWFGNPRDGSQWDPADPLQAWDKQLNRQWGLKWHQAFAAKHGKRMSYSEWGVESKNAGPYVLKAKDWFRANNVVFHTYWDSDNAFPGKLSDNSDPDAGAAFRNAFGR